MSGNLNCQGTQVTPEGTRDFNFDIPLGLTDETRQIELAVGNTNVPVPPGAKGVIIIPPSGNAVAITIDGNGIDPANPMIRSFPNPPPSQMVVNAAAAIANVTKFDFYG